MNELIPIGIAEIDVTPKYPVRLSGYGARREETSKVATPLYARALAIGSEEPVLLLTLDNCGVSECVKNSIALELEKLTGITQERIALCYTHTHSGPMLSGVAPMLFSADISSDHQQHIDRYTEEVTGQLVQVGIQALSDREQCRLSYYEGHVGFAVNRRQEIGPVDHVMPMIRIDDSCGKLRAVWISYACHCTSLGPSDNFICGDWAGFAAQTIKQNQAPAFALVTIGCAANANPFPRTGLPYARRHGRDIAWEVNRLLDTPGRPLTQLPQSRTVRTQLPYDTMPSREEWLAKAKEQGPAGYHARQWIAHMEAGKKVPEALGYTVQTWTFGAELAMVFLTGEVVADYASILRRMYDPSRLWVGAYANDLPGYIPSRRIWREGGYEAGDAMVFFGLPNRFSDEVEQRVIDAVQQVIPDTFRRS